MYLDMKTMTSIYNILFQTTWQHWSEVWLFSRGVPHHGHTPGRLLAERGQHGTGGGHLVSQCTTRPPDHAPLPCHQRTGEGEDSRVKRICIKGEQ